MEKVRLLTKDENTMDKIKFCIVLLALISIFPVLADEPAMEEIKAADADSVSTAAVEQPGLCRNLFVELGGASYGWGLGYDSRFKPGSVFGYRVGMAFNDGYYGNAFGDDRVDYKGVSFPLEVNAIMGRWKSKFELGAGIVPSILKRDEYRWEKRWINEDYEYGRFDRFNYFEKHGTRVNIMGVMNIGYRYQRQRGFFMRAGLSLLLGDISCSPIDGMRGIIYMAFGYTL